MATAIVGHEMSQEAWDESQMLTMQVVTGVQGLLERFQVQIAQQIQQLAVQQQQQQAMHQWLLQQVLAQQQEQKALLQQRAATASSEGDGTPAAKGCTRSTPGAPCAQWPQVQIPPPHGRHPAVQQQSNLLQLPPLLHSLPARTQPPACNRLPQPPVSQKAQEKEKGRPLMEPPSEEAEYEAASEEKQEEAERSETTVAPEASPEVQAEASDASPEAKESPEDKECKETDQTEHESSTKHAEEKNSFAEVESVTENPVKEELREAPKAARAACPRACRDRRVAAGPQGQSRTETQRACRGAPGLSGKGRGRASRASTTELEAPRQNEHEE